MTKECLISTLELGYKHLHLSGKHLDLILEPDIYNDFFASFGSVDEDFYPAHRSFALKKPILNEESTINNNRDICILRYPRYFPPHTHSHDFLELYYVVKQPVKQIVENRSLTLSKGDLLFISPGTRHNFSIMNDDGVAFFIAIRLSTFESALYPLLNCKTVLSDFFIRSLYSIICSPYLLFSTGDDATIHQIIMEMCEETDKNLALSNHALNLHFQRLCIHLMRHHNKKVYMQGVKSNYINDNNFDILSIISYILNNYNSVTLQEISDHFNYSNAHLCRIIKNYTGKSFVEIRSAARIKHAANMLKNTDMNIEKIAEAVGYSEISSFYKVFKEFQGITPGEYRIKM